MASQPEENRGEHEEAALLEPPQNETKRTKSWWFWRILWTILAALFLAIFIKGWVDARDVDVSGLLVSYTILLGDKADKSLSLIL